MRVLVINAGSRSVKLHVLDDTDRPTVVAADLGPPGDDLDEQLADFLAAAGDIDAAGHRVVHGGRHFTSTVFVDSGVRDRLSDLNELAPLHNPFALSGIDAVARLLPGIPSVACSTRRFTPTCRRPPPRMPFLTSGALAGASAATAFTG